MPAAFVWGVLAFVTNFIPNIGFVIGLVPPALIARAWVLGPLGALLAVPMSLFFRAVLVEMDPDASWITPLVSGQPERRSS